MVGHVGGTPIVNPAMLFSTAEFLFVYLPLAWLVHYVANRHSAQAGHWALITVSLVFYGWWDIRYVPLLLGSIATNWALALWINTSQRKGSVLAFGLLFNLGLLGYYKYAGFFVGALNDAVGLTWAIPAIVLPLGISFFSFQQVGYLVDAYRGGQPCRVFSHYALMVTFFPHQIAGPIVDHRTFLPQVASSNPHLKHPEWIARGLAYLIIGLSKKVVLADSIAPWVDQGFQQSDTLSGMATWVVALLYSLQLYFDFSGYSDMAIGLALLFGYQLPINFDSPYRASNIQDFWRRWHMSLGTFIRGYVYIPLGGNRRPPLQGIGVLVVTMTVVGLWHGAGWQFLVWGALHGIYLAMHRMWTWGSLSLPRWLGRLLMLVAVVVAWVVFRAPSLTQAGDMLASMFQPSGFFQGWHPSLREAVVLVLGCVALTQVNSHALVAKLTPSVTWGGRLVAMSMASLALLGQSNTFLYFQF